ncbi:MAG: MBL fold metallo-hydrolase [Nitrososphaerales archaeon]
MQDWNNRDFHGLYTPKGGSYDVYLILDEKIALIDAVKHEFFDEPMANILRIIEPEKIDYVIMKHAELDHAGALLLVMKEAKNAKIITTKKGKDYLYKYHKALWESSWEVITVKERDEISLGKKTLRFDSKTDEDELKKCIELGKRVAKAVKT